MDDAATPTPHADAERRRGPGAIVAFTATLAAFAAAAGVVFNEVLTAAGGVLSLPWLLITVLYVLSEARVVHIEFRREAHSFSLSELPLVLGLFSLSGHQLVAAAVIGSFIALAAVRKQTRLKLVFNLTAIWLATTVVAVLFNLLASSGSPTSPATWGVVLIAAGAGQLVAVTAISGAIALAEGKASSSGLSNAAVFGLVNTATSVSIALVGVLLVAVRPSAAALLLIPVATVYGAFRAYTSERRKHESLEFLYESSRLLQGSHEVEQAVHDLLVQAQVSLRTRVAELTLFPQDADEPVLRAAVDTEAPAGSLAPIESTPAEQVLRTAAEAGATIRIRSEDDHPELWTYIQERGFRDAMLAPLVGETRVIGVMIVADRLVEVSSFRDDDLRLFDTLAAQTSISLENGRLERTLAQLTELKEQLREQAYHDALTGLANRAHFTEAVAEAVDASEGRGLGVLYLDLDDFKAVNDTMGHPAGDALLVTIADRLRDSVRPRDLIARLGGDEFAILLHELDDAREAHALADRIRSTIARPMDIAGADIRSGCSIGIALASDDETAEELVRNADIAMYEAKHGGKDAVAVFEPGMQENVVRRTSLRMELERALVNDELRVHYQPFYRLSDGAVSGLEALVRWQHPTRGLLAPGAFLDVAHESGLIEQIDAFVLAEACRVGARWAATFDEHLVMSVNASARRLSDPGFVPSVTAALRASGLAANNLQLEVTEHQMLADGDQTIAVLDQLRALDVRVAVDDFGTGFSSLAYLRSFPIDVIKIAKPFVDDIRAPQARELAHAIIELCRVLGVRTIAEGIETQTQHDLLAAWGCDVGQGFLLSRPVGEEQAEQLLRDATEARRRPALAVAS